MFRSGLARLTSAVSAPLVHGQHLRSVESEASSAKSFDLGRMVTSFEAVTFPHDATHGARGNLPHTDKFLNAMLEITFLFDHLGAAFSFVKRDILQKVSILRDYAAEKPEDFESLDIAIDMEISSGIVDSKPAPSAARTLLRLMWALKFIDCLLSHLSSAVDPNSKMPDADRTLRVAVANAYDTALSEHHAWTIRRTVHAALLLLPTKEAFMNKLCPNEMDRHSYLKRLSASMTPMQEQMYRFYEARDLLNLP